MNSPFKANTATKQRQDEGIRIESEFIKTEMRKTLMAAFKAHLEDKFYKHEQNSHSNRIVDILVDFGYLEMRWPLYQKFEITDEGILHVLTEKL